MASEAPAPPRVTEEEIEEASVPVPEDVAWALDAANELARQFPERRAAALRAAVGDETAAYLRAEHGLHFYWRKDGTIGVEGDQDGARGTTDRTGLARAARMLEGS